MKRSNAYGPMFNIARQVLIWFLFGLFGLSLAFLLSPVFGVLNFWISYWPLIVEGLLHLGAVTFCVVAIAVLTESLK
ncbi:MAG TPA: hypothetical protein V6D04_06930 [Candidatus Obscuribacterales bacterium]